MIALDQQLADLEGAIPSEAPAQDERGTVLLHRLLDAELAHERATLELEAARKELAAYTAAVRTNREPEVATVATEEPKQHHPSFSERERRWFYAQLGGICKRRGYNKKYAEDLSEVAFKRIRPSGMPARHVRADYLAWLETPEGVEAYERFHEARVQELVEKIENTSEVQCFNCDKRHRLENCPRCGCSAAPDRQAA